MRAIILRGFYTFYPPFSLRFMFVCNRGDTIQYHGGLQSRELGQAPMLLVFLTPSQALSSDPLLLADGNLRCGMYPAGKVAISWPLWFIL